MEAEFFKLDPEHAWLTADTHFGHENIIRYCGRPFRTVEEHDRALMAAFSHLTARDVLVHLGDVCFGTEKAVGNNVAWFASLPCKKLLLLGNHDRRNEDRLSRAFEFIPRLCAVDAGRGMRAVLCHYPLEEWDGAFRGSLHFHGHVHGRRPSQWRREDVGVDAQGFRPVLLAELVSRLSKRKPMGDDR